MLILEVLKLWAEQHAETIALTAPDYPSLSYADLYGHLQRLTAQLTVFGLGPDDRIVVVLPNGPAMALSLLATMSVAACAPLNPDYREREFDFYLSDLDAKVLIVPEGSNLPAAQIAHQREIPVLTMSEGFTLASAGVELRTAVDNHVVTGEQAAQAVALLLHTSGTTSRPKLVPLTHVNLLTSAKNIAHALQLTPTDRCLNMMPLFHIHGIVAALLAPLVSGGSVVCPSGFYAPEFFAWLQAFRPTWYTAVPTMHQAILARAQAHPASIRDCRLRFIRSSSAALPTRVLAELEQTFHVPVIEAYGMTEAAHQMASNPLPPAQRKPGSVGRAAGPEVAIMDDVGNLLPEGTTGEVVIRGTNVTSGYLGSADINAAAFTQGWFRTGDQGYLDADRYLFLTGRLKELINRGGEKITPREVDEVLLQHPAVSQAVTFAVPHPTLGEEVTAAVVLHEHATATSTALREFAATKLAPFKVPSQIVIRDEIPKGPTGKVQRLGLAEKLGLTASPTAQSSPPVPFAPPTTPLEMQIATIWAAILRVERIGRHDNFFDLGGDSVLAAQIISRLRSQLHAEVSLLTFMEHPTVSDLAQSLQATRRTDSSPQSPLCPIARARPLPLSFAQQTIWFEEQRTPGTSQYNRPVALRLDGPLDAPALERSIKEVVQRHEILRTTYHLIEGEPRQVIASQSAIPLTVMDLRSFPSHEREARARQLSVAEAHRLFDLGRGPVLRATVFRVDESSHILLVVLHHIASDGWSNGIFLHELAAFYSAAVTRTQVSLPPIAVQYADFAQWEQRQSPQHIISHLSFWQERLTGDLPILTLPVDFHRQQSSDQPHGATERLQLSTTLTAQLKHLSRQHNATLFMTLLTTLQVLLHRLSGQEDILIGTPVAGRSHEDVEPLIGTFMNMLIFRADVSGNSSFTTLLSKVRERTLQALAHQDMPLITLTRQLHFQRSGRTQAPYQVIFNFRNLPLHAVTFIGLEVNSFEFDDGTAQLDLTLEIIESAGSLTCIFKYDTDLFAPATIRRWAKHFETLLQSIVTQPNEPIGLLSILTAQEHDQLIIHWNETERSYPHDYCVHQLFEAKVIQTPDAIAVVFEGQQLTYRELNARANQLAHRLRVLGVGPEVLVGIYLERSLDLMVALVGVLKAGGAYVPLDPAYPQDRLAFMLQDAQVPVLLTQAVLLADLPQSQSQVVCLDRDWASIVHERDTPLVTAATAANVAYMIYTSGSTGKPKGVLIQHRGVVNHSLAMARHFMLGPQDRVAQCASLSFDIAVEEIFPTWLSGAAVILRPPGFFSPGTEFLRWVAAEGITELNLPTAFWHEWVSELERSHESLPPALRLVVVGGEKAAAQAVARWRRIAGDRVRWVNTYGPTETTVTTTLYEPLAPPTSAAEGESTEIPIGRPIANVQVYVLDRYLQPVPIGVRGELYIGGVGLGRGYHNRDQLTAEKFIRDPFSSDPHARLYKTGDLARYLPDGNIEFLGRTDHQVKIRGYRIELAEIESVLSQHPVIRDVVVLEDSSGDATTSSSTDKRLVAYVVAPPDTSTNELRSFLKQKLPEFMVPSAFMCLDSLPLTPSGKVDRRALPIPDQRRSKLGETYVGPRGPLEETVARIWAEALKLEKVGVHDNFFEIGGHSLLIVRVQRRLCEALGKDVSIVELFKHPTISSLVSFLSEGKVAQLQVEDIEQRARWRRATLVRRQRIPNDDRENT